MKQPFEINIKGARKLQVAGCAVDQGQLLSSGSFQVKRKGEIVHIQHKDVSLRHYKVGFFYYSIYVYLSHNSIYLRNHI